MVGAGTQKRSGAKAPERKSHKTQELTLLRLFFDDDHLAATIAARLQVDMMRAAKLAGIRILDIGRGRNSVVAPPVAPLHARHFSLRNSHF